MKLAQDMDLAQRVEHFIRIIEDFPNPKVRFRDISPLIEEAPALFREVIDRMAQTYKKNPPDRIVCIESWGYIFGAPLAYILGTPITLVRRSGKLPRSTIGEEYRMSYSPQKSLEIHLDAVKKDEKILIVDDVIASGGSTLATLKLVEAAGGTCIGVCCLAAFPDGPFTKEVEKKGITIHSIARL